MARYEQLPVNYRAARPILERVLTESAAVNHTSAGSRRRPDPPRSVIAQAGSLEVLITWNSPVRLEGIIGWRIYRDMETNRVEEIRDPSRRSTRVKVPANTNIAFYVSSFNAKGVESIKVPVIGKANTDQYVVSGTTGGTGGSAPAPPPEWPNEPLGGKAENYLL